VARVFESLGWRVARQRSSHVIMVRPGSIASLSIPDHKEVAAGTLRSLIRSARMTLQDFVEASRRL
jgi:predicted RNA binding protein YcfA (HicA-like mRNA interferase family)